MQTEVKEEEGKEEEDETCIMRQERRNKNGNRKLPIATEEIVETCWECNHSSFIYAEIV